MLVNLKSRDTGNNEGKMLVGFQLAWDGHWDTKIGDQ
jgi:hypothetical protein